MMGNDERALALWQMINPLSRTRDTAGVATYKVEPYVVAADVYALAPHAGRGGWTWYTGSAGWMYRLLVESLLGLRREGSALRIAPCLPVDWTTFSAQYRYGETAYHIAVTQTIDGSSGQQMNVDGVDVRDTIVSLVDDRQEHRVAVTIHRSSAAGEA
jgi:cellobiose phosphorylase